MIDSYVSNALIQSQIDTYANCDKVYNKMCGCKRIDNYMRGNIPIHIYIYIYIINIIINKQYLLL